jgi:hypothetical protein
MIKLFPALEGVGKETIETFIFHENAPLTLIWANQAKLAKSLIDYCKLTIHVLWKIIIQ